MKALNRSKLSEYEAEILRWHESGCSYRNISEKLNQEYKLSVSHNAVYSFLKVREPKKYSLFFSGLPDDIKESLLKQLNILWTHNSTAIEGNTLTLGETAAIIESGLTVSGKSLREHEEVYGHAKAVELILSLLEKEKIEKEDLFDLHRSVMQKSAIDIMRPIGNWKRDYNGTTGVRDGKPVYMEFSSPEDVPVLMYRWLKEFNRKLSAAGSSVKAVNVYTWAHITFVRIHPFFDGNGRIARLIANLPLLKCGYPPILISSNHRIEYIQSIWEYQNAVGVLKRGGRLLQQDPILKNFKDFIKQEWKEAEMLVTDARKQAKKRESGRMLNFEKINKKELPLMHE